MTIQGSNFDPGAIDQVYRGETFIGQGVIVSRSSTSIVVDQRMTGVGVDTYTIYVKNSDGTQSNGLPFEITEDPPAPASDPMISSISPSSKPDADADFRMTIRGVNFDSGVVDEVYRGGTLIGQGSIVSRTSTRIVVDQRMTGIGVGIYTIKVKNSDGTRSNGVPFEITADLPAPTPPPSISTVSPSSKPNSDADFRMTIRGSDFDSGAVDEVYRGGTFIGQGSIVSRTSTRIVVDQRMTGIGVGTYTIKVKNSDGTRSNGAPFEITADTPPSVSSVSPSSMPNSSADFRMTIDGGNFDTGAVDQVYRGGTFIGQGTIVSRSSTRIVVDQRMTGIGVGTYTIRVKNSDGTLSNGVPFVITSALRPPPE